MIDTLYFKCSNSMWGTMFVGVLIMYITVGSLVHTTHIQVSILSPTSIFKWFLPN